MTRNDKEWQGMTVKDNELQYKKLYCTADLLDHAHLT
jgi:hypothetical protein